MKHKTRNALFYGIFAIGIVLVLLLEWHKASWFSYEPYGQIHYEILSRLVAGLVCVALLCRFSLSHLFVFKSPIIRPFLMILPCFAIAINNFPILSVLMGDTILGTNVADYIVYALLCLAVGFFEEVAFRGCVFTVALERMTKITSPTLRVFAACVTSSALFGLVHLANLFAGASLGYVLLQVCYSFLIGGMCAIIMVKTANIWYGILLHAIYNFAGGVVPEFGAGQIWTIPTVVLTVVVSLIVAAYVLFLLFRVREEEMDTLLKGRAHKKQTDIPT